MNRTDEIIEQLQGTCKSLNEVLTDEEQDDMNVLTEIDNHIFRCEECDWWCEVSERHEDEDVCVDCGDDQQGLCPDEDEY